MKIQRYIIAVIVFLTVTLPALAQSTNLDVTVPTAPTALPQTKADFWLYAIAIVTPLIVAGVKKLVPNIPSLLLPLSTPVIGLALGAGLNWLTAKNYGWVDIAQVGGLAVFVREVVDQAVKTKKASLPPPTDG